MHLQQVVTVREFTTNFIGLAKTGSPPRIGRGGGLLNPLNFSPVDEPCQRNSRCVCYQRKIFTWQKSNLLLLRQTLMTAVVEGTVKQINSPEAHGTGSLGRCGRIYLRGSDRRNLVTRHRHRRERSRCATGTWSGVAFESTLNIGIDAY